jgi:WD40 repeat protein
MPHLCQTFLVAVGLALTLPKAASSEPSPSPPARTDRYGDPLPEGGAARLGTVRWRLAHPIAHCATYTPDGKILVTANPAGGVSLWDAATGQVLRLVPEDPTLLQAFKRRCVALSADARTVAIEQPDQAVRIVDAATGTERSRCHGHQGQILALALSTDGRVLASRALDQTLRLWDTSTGRERLRLSVAMEKHQRRSLALAPDGKTVAWIGKDDTVVVADAATGKERHRLQGHTETVRQLAFSPDGRTLASTGGDAVRVWDVATGRPVGTLRGRRGDNFGCVLFAPDGRTLAASLLTAQFVHSLQLWDLATGKELWRVPTTYLQGEIGMAFSPDGKTLINLATPFVDPTMHRYLTATGEELLRPEGHRGPVSAVAVTADGRRVHSLGLDETLRGWETATGKQLGEIPVEYGFPAFSPDGRWLATLSRGNVLLYRTGENQPRRLAGHPPANHYGMAFTPDGRLLAVAGPDKTVALWETATGKEVRRFPVGKEPVGDLLFSPDGRMLAESSRPAENRSPKDAKETAFAIHFWGTATGHLLRTLRSPQQPQSMAFSPDGKTLVLVGADREAIEFWEVATGRKRLELSHSAILHAMTFSPDGNRFVTGGRSGALQGSVRAWDPYTGQLLGERPGHRGPILALAFTPDGRHLATGSWDTTVLVWEAAGLVSGRKPRAGPLTAAEAESLWSLLAGREADQAGQAMARLMAAPEQGVRLLGERLRPATGVGIERLIADLDNDRFTVRENAEQLLEKLGPTAEAALNKALESRPTLETRRRLERLLERRRGPVTDSALLRGIRGTEVLEHVGTREAREILKMLAQGASEARLTQEAKASLERLAQRPPIPPAK